MEKPKIFKRVTTLIIVFVIAGGCFLGYNFYQRWLQRNSFAQTFAQSGGTAVERVSKTDLQEIITISGTVSLKSEEKVYSEGTGVIDEILVEIGDAVNSGEVLITFNNNDTLVSLEKQLAEAQINLHNQQLTLQSLVLTASSSELKNLNNAITSAERNIKDSERNITSKESIVEDAIDAYNITNEKIENYMLTVDKMKKAVEDNEKLLDVGGISPESYQDSLENYNNALITLDEYYKTLESNEKAIEEAKKSVEDAKESLSYTHADLENAKQDLSDANVVLKDESERINYEKQLNQIKLSEMNIQNIQDDITKLIDSSKSNVSGIVTGVYVENRASITDKTLIISVADFSSLIVKADVSEFDAPSLELRQKVEMISDGISGVTYIGEVTKIGTQAVTKSTSGGSEAVVEIEVTLNNPDGKIKPGFSLDMDIILVDMPEVINVSISAIQRDRETNEHYVFTVDENRAVHKTPVILGVYGDLNVEVLNGLNEGDLIVTSPDTDMYDGMEITIGMGNRPSSGTSNEGGRMPNGGMINFGGGGTNSSGPVRIVN